MRRRVFLTLAAGAGAGATAALFRGCSPSASKVSPSASSPDSVPTIDSGPRRIPSVVRVRIGRAVASTRITARGGGLWIHPSSPLTPSATATPIASGPSIEVRRSAGVWVVNSQPMIAWAGASMSIEPVGSARLSVDGAAYPGSLQLVAAGDRAFDIINHVPIDDYLPGVLDRELYDSWHVEAYKAQAVAARSYAIEGAMNEGASRPYDVESTVASQAYQGASGNAKALEAARDTAGVVLTWRGEVLRAYYSSTCGGLSQTPSQVRAAWIKLDVPPLLGHDPHDWCSAANYYRWGPIERHRGELSDRIAAWAAANREEAGETGAIGPLRDIRVARRTEAGRPVLFALVGDNGRTAAIRADALRHAANHPTPGHADVTDAKRVVRSGHFDIHRAGERFIFENGRGFGHGIGMCQFAAQAMARAGYRWEAILEHHYPRAALERVY